MSSLARQVLTEYTHHEVVNQQVALGPGILLKTTYTESLFLKKLTTQLYIKISMFQVILDPSPSKLPENLF